MQVAAGTIPPGYQWLSNIAGYPGHRSERTCKTWNTCLNSNDPNARIFHNEAAFYFLYLKFYILNQREEVFQIYTTAKLEYTAITISLPTCG